MTSPRFNDLPVFPRPSFSHSHGVTQNAESSANDVGLHEMDYIGSDNDVEATENEDSEDSEDTESNAFEPQAFTPSTAPDIFAEASRAHEEPQEDSESSDDEVESVSSHYSDTDRISSRLSPHEETDEVSVRSPVSTEPWAIEYTSRIKDLIQNTLMKIGITFFSHCLYYASNRLKYPS